MFKLFWEKDNDKSWVLGNADALNEMITGVKVQNQSPFDILNNEMTNEEILENHKLFKEAAETKQARTEKVMSTMLQYVTWQHMDDSWMEYTSPVNVFWFLVDVLIAYSTASIPDWDVLAYDESKTAQDFAELAQRYLKAKYDEQNWRDILKKAALDAVLAREWYLEVVRKNGTTKVEYVPLQKLILDPEASDYGLFGDASWYIKKIDNYSVKQLIRAYPEKKAEIEKLYWKDEKNHLKRPTSYEINTTKQLQCVILDDKVVLKRILNPTVKYTDEDKIEDSIYWKILKVSRKYNLVDEPFLPLFSISFGNFGKLGSGTNPFDQARPIQDALDDTNFTINHNRKKVWYAKLVWTWLTHDELVNIADWDPEEVVWLNDWESLDYLQHPQVPWYVLQDRAELTESMFNITWIHPISFGQKDWNATLWERKILKQWDENRIASLAWNIEKKVWEIGLAYLQMERINTTEEQAVPVLWEKGWTEFIKFNPSKWKYGIKLMVQPGSLFPKDEAWFAETVKSLFEKQAMSIGTLLKAHKIPNPDGEVNKIMFEKLIAKVNEQKVMEYVNYFHETNTPYTTELLVKAVTWNFEEWDEEEKAVIDKADEEINKSKQAASQPWTEQVPPTDPSQIPQVPQQ